MASSSQPAARPLSPHLQVYRFTLLMTMSIVHRITGGALYVGTLLLVWFLVALASGEQAYATFQWAAGSWLGILVLFGYTWALFHHMMGGIRHLVWDNIAALDVPSAKRLTAALSLAALALTILAWLLVFSTSLTR